MGLTDVLPSEQEELDFSDVFGPDPQSLAHENVVASEDSLATSGSCEKVYNDPEVVYSRSHSLVGPTACVTLTRQLSKLMLHESENSLELIECANDEGEVEKEDSAICATQEDVSEGVVGLDHFEVLKVVGQGAFGKVFQVRKRGSSDIYAMKVMRKDKIMEKNHTEYMKAERDILTKVDHPFIVPLRYSFQVQNFLQQFYHNV